MAVWLRNNLVLCGGILVGAMGAVLVKFGNPANMGICFVCFYRDISGALGLHLNPMLQYLRPEIIGIFLGSFISALVFREFNPRGGSSPGIRFLLGMLIMVGGLIFLGCPIRAIYRLAGGDLSSLGGLLGLPFGAYLGLHFLTKGYNLGKARPLPAWVALLPLMFFGGLLVLLAVKLWWQTPYPFFSLKGPGSQHAPVLLSLALGGVAGVLFQRFRLCLSGGFRDVFLFNDYYLLKGFMGILIGAFAANLVLGQFRPGPGGAGGPRQFRRQFPGHGPAGTRCGAPGWLPHAAAHPHLGGQPGLLFCGLGHVCRRRPDASPGLGSVAGGGDPRRLAGPDRRIRPGLRHRLGLHLCPGGGEERRL